MSNLIIGTCGHIDHGKTSLIKALNGFDGDSTKEEKERGITIDLSFSNKFSQNYFDENIYNVDMKQTAVKILEINRIQNYLI